jgi:predicted hotdog family 3-hydroxylacyl-ACP dehydratase
MPLSTAHPLARRGVVPAIAACEYAAQAAAVHGALLDGADAPRAGMLAKIMEVDLHAPQFPLGGDAVTVVARLLSRLGTGCLYDFEVSDGARAVASGRLIVAFSSGEPA